MKIVVIGGTGLIGSKVISNLRKAGHEAVAAAPNTGINNITGEGLAEASTNAEVVVDLANAPDFSDEPRPLDPTLRVPWSHRAIVDRWPDHSSFASKTVTDVHARYFRAELNDKSRAPGDTAHIGSTSFETWFGHA